jgi:hypothetical protein
MLKRKQESLKLLTECFLALGTGFATLAVPLALDARWTTAVWAVEGAGVFWVGMRQARWMPRAFGLALQGIAALAFYRLWNKARSRHCRLLIRPLSERYCYRYRPLQLPGDTSSAAPQR